MDKFVIHDKRTFTCNFYKTLNKSNLKNYGILREIANNKQITIRKADKGASFVILDMAEYLREAHQQLGNLIRFRNRPTLTMEAA